MLGERSGASSMTHLVQRSRPAVHGLRRDFQPPVSGLVPARRGVPGGILVIDGLSVGSRATLWRVAAGIGEDDRRRNALFEFFDVQYYFGFHTSLFGFITGC